jgi:uncharacterized protein (DUF2252 family)
MKQKAPKAQPPEDRSERLTAARNLKMAQSAHAYVRGNTAKFYEWLDSQERGTLPEGPPIWICGDCHIGNLGPVSSHAGDVEIQIRDLDQTVIGNPAHDLIRLGLSLASAARGSDLPGITTVRMIEQIAEGYDDAFDEDARQPEQPAAVKLAMQQALGRSWKHLAKDRIGDTRPKIPLGKRFWPLSDEERAATDALFEEPSVRRLVTALRSRDDDAEVEVQDAAYWMKGCSSLGRLRQAVLVKVSSGGPAEFCIVDIKEAVQAAAPRYQEPKMPRDNGERVVEGARQLAPYLGGRMRAARLQDRAVFLRELRPQDLKLELEQLTQGEAMLSARYLADVVGRAHARQMDPPARRKWLTELRRNRTKTLDAPSWLWSAVVELVASHEAAYLDHCRRYATGEPEAKTPQ